MEPIKLIFEKTDTFKTIREKLLGLLVKQVVNTEIGKPPYTIFAVGEIIEGQLGFLGEGFLKFLEGDLAYTDGQGGYNFEGMGGFPVWEYIVTYGMQNADGYRMSQNYKFYIPRKGTLDEDFKNSDRIHMPNHPFVFFEFDNKPPGNANQ